MAKENDPKSDQMQTLGDLLITRPKIGLTVLGGLLLITGIAMKCDSDQRQRDCLQPSPCHRRLWEQTHPGEKYPADRITFPSGFRL